MTMQTESSLSALLLRAAEGAIRRAREAESSADALRITKAQADVAEAVALWGDTPIPAAAGEYVFNVATLSSAREVETAASRAICRLGDPKVIARFNSGECDEGSDLEFPKLVEKMWIAIGDGKDAPFADEHPATAAEVRRRVDAWIALPEDKWFIGGHAVLVLVGLGGRTYEEDVRRRLGMEDEYNRRKIVADSYYVDRRAKREAADARKIDMIEMIVDMFGSDDLKAGRAEKLISNSEVVHLLWSKVFRPETPKDLVISAVHRIDQANWYYDYGYGGDWPNDVFFGADDKIEPVERVSLEAYNAFSALRARMRTETGDPRDILSHPSWTGAQLAMFNPVTIGWALERVRSDLTTTRLYVARCKVSFNENTITLTARRFLGMA
jgi:hypothetical protein